MEPLSTIIMQPLEIPCRVLLGLHDDSTERFFLKNLYICYNIYLNDPIPEVCAITE